MILLRISSRETLRATTVCSERLLSLPNASTSDATRAISDIRLAMRISLDPGGRVADRTEDRMAMDIVPVPRSSLSGGNIQDFRHFTNNSRVQPRGIVTVTLRESLAMS